MPPSAPDVDEQPRFQHFYGLAQRLHPSKLASIDEERYRSPDTMRGREAADTLAFH
jgi:hypothetical protein